MKKHPVILSHKGGFSLVELLVVIAVIAIIAAIAIPNIVNVTSQAGYAKDQRNAQNIASVAAAAVAAGSKYSGLGTANTALVTALEDGSVTATNGGQVQTFGISPLSDAETTNALRHLTNATTTGGAVSYRPVTNAY